MAVAPGENRANIARLYLRVTVLAGTVCAALAATSSWVVLLLLLSGAFTEVPGYGVRILIKALIFTALTAAGAIWFLARSRVSPFPSPRGVESAAEQSLRPIAHVFRWELFLVIAAAALLVFPNLGRFPATAPDELHHLIVARNLGVHGSYASGLPPDKLVYFDYYDSVGPTLIAPVAAALRVLDVDVAHGRIPMALLSLVFPVVLYFLFAEVWGRAAGTLAALMPLGAFGTVYLARTLYGEVPALTFLLVGLLLWRRSIGSSSLMLSVGAGLFFGLAVLTKTFLALAAFAFAGAWLYDRATERRVGWRSVLPTAVGAVVPFAVWSVIRFIERDLIGEQPSMAVYYRHMLVFGLEPLIEQLPRFLDARPVVAASLLMLAAAVPRVFQARFDPALAVVFLIAAMFTFWWVFFTPMHIPRYLWYTAAISAALGGGVFGADGAVRGMSMLDGLRVGLAMILLAAYIVPVGRVAAQVYSLDHTAADHELVEYVRSLPPDTPLATTYWPAERLINFALSRGVDVVGETVDVAPADAVLIASDRMGAPTTPQAVEPLRFGHYRVERSTSAAFKGE